MIDVQIILSKQFQQIIAWHNVLNETETLLPWQFIEENNKHNFSLWHEEDIARMTTIGLDRIVIAKRNIDKYNQARNNAMEKIDEWILSNLIVSKKIEIIPIHSETPGMMIDRLSIMNLKKYHFIEETKRFNIDDAHLEMCNNRIAILNEQIGDLANSLKLILGRIYTGELRFKVYRQFKMYNDPKLNPQLYKQQL